MNITSQIDKRDYKSILFVCTGNICRSPIAAALFSDRLDENSQFLASSAGIRGLDGQSAHPFAQRLMHQRGIDITNHKARTVTPSILMSADLILTMEKYQLDWIKKRIPSITDRLFLLSHNLNGEILDPINGDLSDFQDVINQIEDHLSIWLEQLSPEMELG